MINPDLFSGFLSGIYSFSEEISDTGGIETMELKDLRLLYGVASDLIYILSSTKDEEVDTLRNKIADISQAFHQKYGHYLIDWDRNVTTFKPFEKDLDSIIQRSDRVETEDVLCKIPSTKRLKLSEEEFQVLSLCDGKTPYTTIATKLKFSELKLIKIIKNLEKKKVIQRKRIIKV